MIRFSDSVLGIVGLGAFSGAGLVEGRWAAATSEKARKMAALAFISSHFGRLGPVLQRRGTVREPQHRLSQVDLVARLESRSPLVTMHFAAQAFTHDPDAAASLALL